MRKATDWKAVAWNLEGENVHSVLYAPGPAVDVTKDLGGTWPPIQVTEYKLNLGQ